MKRHTSWLAGTLTALSATGAHAAPIVGGAPTTADPAVASVLLFDANDNTIALCSGTLVAPTIVMTAAHCVDGKLAAAKYGVWFGTQVEQHDPGFVFGTLAKRVSVHPMWNPDDVTAGFDLGLIELEAAPPITPIPINTHAFTAADVGQPTTLVGWGVTGTSADDAGTKRSVVSQLSEFDDKLLVIGNATTNVCHGDSGGPALMTFAGTTAVVGVTSFGDAMCGQVGVSTRVDAYLDFLRAAGVPVPAVTPPATGSPDAPDDPDDPGGPTPLPPHADDGGCNGAGSTSLPLVLLALVCMRLVRHRTQGEWS